ncbi:neuroligin-4, X-linked-like isoform X2 [Brevipalpus obovatus]|uniref:neuroligin-4, X-linked-like isoform X2 n=1 Tax=Brevipalpus obovatus TaxID=246614 RepID=UPI003D9DF07E
MINMTRFIFYLIVIAIGELELIVTGNNQFGRILSPRIVKTKSGSLKGLLLKLRPIEAFLGVPYADPPIDKFRFHAPKTLSSWRGLRLANEYSSVCPQKFPILYNDSESIQQQQQPSKDDANNNSKVNGNYGYFNKIFSLLKNQSEDCLYLNIYTPYNEDASKIKLPVMVYIHGDSYNWGSGNAFDGTILSSVGNIVVVTLNYRLGIFGFWPVSTPPGNHGLLDIIAALNWIHDNIREIGGDPSNITLVGHSRGAALVNLLMISPMSQGLFSKVILMSGSALSSWALAPHAASYAKYLAKSVNCPNYDDSEMVKCLRERSVDELLKVDLNSAFGIIGDDFYHTTFGPIVDNLVIPAEPGLLMRSGDNSLQIDPVYTKIRAKYQNQSGTDMGFGSYPIMFGVTRVEAPILFNVNEQKQGIDLDRRDSILRNIVRNMVNYYQEVITLTLINEYTDWSVPSEHPINILDSLIDIIGDALVVAPITSTANLHFRKSQHHSQTRSSSASQSSSSSSSPSSSSTPSSPSSGIKDRGPAKMFSYVFVYQSESYGYAARLGCIHGDELPYLFGAPISYILLSKTLSYFGGNFTRSELSLSESVITQWTNFIKYGNPNGNLKPVSKDRIETPSAWPEYDSIQRKYLMIGLKSKIRDHYHGHRLSFWLSLIPKLEKHGKEEEDLLQRHSQDQGTPGQVSSFRRISLKFPSSLQSPDFKSSNLFSNSDGTSNTANSGALDSKQSNLMNNFGTNGSAQSAQPIAGYRNMYTTALSMTIAVGILMLTINGLILAGVYYYVRRNRSTSKKKGKEYDGPNMNARFTNHIGDQLDSSQAQQQQQKLEQYTAYCCNENHHLCSFGDDNGSQHLNTACRHRFGMANIQQQQQQQQGTQQSPISSLPPPQSVNGTDEVTKCQCATCYHHQPSICDNEHCITVIHEFQENF